jgi:hypothetical protein
VYANRIELTVQNTDIWGSRYLHVIPAPQLHVYIPWQVELEQVNIQITVSINAGF